LLTAAERRGVLTIALLMALGTIWDVWDAHRPVRATSAPRPSALASEGAMRADPSDSGAAAAASAPRMPRKAAPAAPLDLNHAGPADLTRLPGIGPVLAARIVEARRVRGGFTRTEDLLAVRGIGPRLYQRLERYVALGTARTAGHSGSHAFRTPGRSDSVQILLQSAGPTFR